MSTFTAQPTPTPPTPVIPTSVAEAATGPFVPAADHPGRRHIWIVLGITLLGIVLRFSYMDRPLLWGDDAYTIYRTHADYQSMLEILQYDGFTPLHYQLYWLLGRTSTIEQPAYVDGNKEGPKVRFSTALTPKMVRLWPALWGSLMAPAMYFLAVQLVRRRAALLAALFAACSAYLLGYSRDGKMYMMLWSFTALSTGCLLWWLRVGTRIAWLAWVASSLAMCSSHMTGPAMLPFQAIFLMTRSKVDWKHGLLFVLGLMVIIAGPIGYKENFNRWAQQSEEHYGFDVEGLGWVIKYNEGRTGPELVRYTAPAYLFSWEWPKPVSELKVKPWVLMSLKAATVALLLLAALGAMPWSRRLRGMADGGNEAGAVESPRDASPQPWWRVLLWLSLWIVIPVYFIYCRSMVDFVPPSAWWEAIAQTLAPQSWQVKPEALASSSSPQLVILSGMVNPMLWVWVVVGAIAVAAGVFAHSIVRRVVIWTIPAVALFGLIYCQFRPGLAAPVTDWTAKAIWPLFRWWYWITQPFFAWVLVLVLPGLAVYYCGASWKSRLARVTGFLVIAAIVIGTCVAVYKIAHGVLEQKIEKVAGEFLQKNPGYASPRTTPEARAQMERNAREAAIKALPKRPEWHSIFMPRYFGFVWIGFCIALAALYMRLPTWPLRTIAVLLLIAVNLVQFGGRLFAGTEPPLDLVARDVWQHDTVNNKAKADPTARVFVNEGGVNDEVLGGAGHPGCGALDAQQGRYYLGVERGWFIHPSEWKRIGSSKYFSFRTPTLPRSRAIDYSAIQSELARDTDVRRAIVWERIFDLKGDRSAKKFENLLGDNWKLVRDEDHVVRFHWEWKELLVMKRLEFERKS